MTRTRTTRRCRECHRPTKSTTGWCRDHRPADAVPEVRVTADGRMVSWAGHNLTAAQALHVADGLVDAAEQTTAGGTP